MRSARLALLLLMAAGCAGSPRPVSDTQDAEPSRARPAPLAAGGAGTPRPSSPSGGPENPTTTFQKIPAPADLAPMVDRAEKIGRLLHHLDQAASKATDELLKGSKSGPNIQFEGYIAYPEADLGVSVFFVHEEGDQLRATAVVEIKPKTPPRLVLHDPPKPLSEFVSNMYRARQAALSAPFPRHSQRYNSVVIPANFLGKAGWAVYLLGATLVPAELVLTGVRIVVSKDFKTITETTPLTASDVRMSLAVEPNQELQYPIFTHIVSEAPLETHVVASLTHNQNLMVLTSRGVWMVVGDSIGYYGKPQRAQPSVAP